MPTSHSSGRRHRGRRGRRSGNQGAAQQQAQGQQQDAQVTVSLPEGVTLTQREAPVEQPVRTQSPPSHQQATPGRGRGDSRGQRPARRRPQPRQAIGPMPTEVLRRGTKVEAPQHERRGRTVEGMVAGPGENFGCPMLTRIKTRMPATGYQNAPRCSMAWSLHNEDEALLCMYTPDLIDCWKAHPEKVEGLQALIAESESEPNAAD